MSKILFADGSYIECSSSDETITFVIQAKDNSNELKKISNCVSMSREEFEKLISDINN